MTTPASRPDGPPASPRTGAELLLATAAAAGVEACFANPGTTELGLVNAFDAVPAVRAVLCQFEGVCSGAADGWGRMRDLPALALFHLGPGLANGLANLHNARRARTPLLAVVGEHATWHRDADAPLASDIEGLARPVSSFVRTSSSAAALGDDAAAAVAAATSAGGGVATLIVPSDCQSGAVTAPPAAVPSPAATRVPDERVIRVAAALRAGAPAALFLGGRALRERGLVAAARAAGACGARLVSECFPARQERGPGLPPVERLPYFPERAAAALAGLRVLVLAGAPEPVAFFGYPGQPSRFAAPSCELLPLASPGEDVERALADLADALGAPAAPPPAPPGDGPPAVPEGALTPAAVSALLARMQPEGAIVVDESATTGLGWFRPSAASPRHTLLTLTGGSIGMGPPLATGAALACPGRPVIDFQGDGAAMYTLQALWTQAREGLHVVTLLCNNRSYRILEVEQQRAGVRPGPRAAALTDLGGPPVDWVLLARGMGVPATRVESTGALRAALGRCLAAPGPHLLELMI